MNLSEFVDRTYDVVASLGDRLESTAREDVSVYLETGEEGLALEVLVGSLARDGVPVSRRESNEILELLQYFSDPSIDSTAEDQPDSHHFWAVMHPTLAVAELNVRDEQ